MSDGKKRAFTKKQILAAEILTDPAFSGDIAELCEKLKIKPSEFYLWLENPDYCKYLNGAVEHYTDSELCRVWKSLISNAVSGNATAQKLYFEMKGKYKQQIDLSGGVVFISGEEEIKD